MRIIPALHLLNGKPVSLYKGTDNAQKVVHRANPLTLAKEFQLRGASLLHVVDLGNSEAEVEKIVAASSAPVQVAGGIRDMKTVTRWIERGAARVVLGVAARHLLREAVEAYGPERIVFGIKARRHKVESESLPKDSDEVVEVAEQAIDQGVLHILYSDMERQGTLFHPNYDDMERLLLLLGERARIYSAGGVAAMEDFKILNELGTAGVVVSRAFVEHHLDMAVAIERYETDEDRIPLV